MVCLGVHDRVDHELEDLATGELPAGVDVAAAVDVLDGAVASAFIRAVKPR